MIHVPTQGSSSRVTEAAGKQRSRIDHDDAHSVTLPHMALLAGEIASRKLGGGVLSPCRALRDQRIGSRVVLSLVSGLEVPHLPVSYFRCFLFSLTHPLHVHQQVIGMNRDEVDMIGHVTGITQIVRNHTSTWRVRMSVLAGKPRDVWHVKIVKASALNRCALRSSIRY